MNVNQTLSPDLDEWINAQNPIVSMSKEYPAGHNITLHQHSRGQLVYGCSGMMELRTRDEYWMLPPLRGVWIPPQVDHAMVARTAVSLRTLYVNIKAFSIALPLHPMGINVSPLLRELLAQASKFHLNYPPESFESRLLSLTLEEMQRSAENGLRLPMGRDKRLRSICDALFAHPGDPRSLSEWANEVGATTRTLTRLFQNETGMPFVHWRQQLRIVDAIPRLIAGERISQIADSLGYNSQGAFTVMFKRVTGKVPSDYFS
ncbi:helix-turn-helix transcriptional regulator [Prodigiosinella aquatilis]|nr:helix-turn-helix transcriptional regulator [Prodigiosinella sp. LS101]WJV53973.1 helix-turn-helix transcriptional regulator [Prodigiosinella sp. LS101]WJV58334.1 helix-turn-helix transcriptional regulator [Pectobacteriaceae bacterium C111]